MSTYTVVPGMTITDAVLNATGNITNWDAILESSSIYNWVPLFTGGETLTIPSTVSNDNNNIRALQIAPAVNNSYNVYPKIDTVFNSLSQYALAITTISTPSVTVPRGTSNNIICVLALQNFTSNSIVITQLSGTIFGQSLGTDIDTNGLKVWQNSTPNFNGSPVLLGAVNVSGLEYIFSLTGLSLTVLANSISYLVTTVNITAASTTGDVVGMQTGINSFTFTVTGGLSQNNQQSDISGIITIGL